MNAQGILDSWLANMADMTRKLKLMSVYPGWMCHLFSKAVEGQCIEDHGPFNRIEFDGNCNTGYRMVFVDASNDQKYEVLVNVMPKRNQ